MGRAEAGQRRLLLGTVLSLLNCTQLQDVEKLCKKLPKDSRALACLREHKEELSEGCKREVFERQAVAADDWRTDPELFEACKVRAALLGVTNSAIQLWSCLCPVDAAAWQSRHGQLKQEPTWLSVRQLQVFTVMVLQTSVCAVPACNWQLLYAACSRCKAS